MATEAKDLITELLRHMGFEITLNELTMDDGPVLDIQTDEPGRLIGRQGNTLADLQYLANRLIFREDPEAPKVTLDVGGYRTKAREALVAKAREAAEKVRKWGDVVEMEPLNSFDRYIVHNALKEEGDIESSSVEVEGTSRKAILLRPKRK